MRRTKRGGWPYSQPPNVQFEINRASPQADGLVLWMPWGGGTPGSHHHIDRVKGLVFTENGTPVWVADGERGWSMLFDDALSEYLENASSTPVTAAPMTLATWFNCDYDAPGWLDLAAIQIQDNAVGNHYITLKTPNKATNTVMVSVRGTGGSVEIPTTTNWTVNAWHHACAVLTAANDRAVYLDAGGKATDNTNIVPAGLNSVSIARSGDSTPGNYYSGRLTDIRIYNHALNDAEVYQLYAEPWELYKPLIRRWVGWRSPAPLPVGGHMTLWGRYWGP